MECLDHMVHVCFNFFGKDQAFSKWLFHVLSLPAVSAVPAFARRLQYSVLSVVFTVVLICMLIISVFQCAYLPFVCLL